VPTLSGVSTGRDEQARAGDTAGVAEDRRDWQRLLREKGYRLTPQRELVLAAVERLGHATPDEVLGAVREQSAAVNISTVYRTLDLLKDMRLISETHMGTGDAAFEWVGKERHHHLICRQCNGVTQFDHHHLEVLGDQIAKETGFHADIDHFAIFGLCAECLREQSGD